MRTRNLKPNFFKNDKLAALSPLARLLYQGLWCLADREGRLEDRPARIKAEILPYDECDIDELLEALADAGFIRRYGPGYIDIPKFRCHQYPSTNEKASIIPAYDPFGTSSVQVPESYPTNPSLYPIPHTLYPIPHTDSSKKIYNSSGDNEFLDEMLALASTIKSKDAEWKPTVADRRTIAALCERFPSHQLRDELLKFKAYCPQREYRLFGRAFASWMGRVEPQPFPQITEPPRTVRIRNALECLAGGMDEMDVRPMVLDEFEWAEALAQWKTMEVKQ